MDEPPRGARRPEDEALYRSKQQLDHIEVDRVSPAVEGYFRIPAVWIGETPAPGAVIRLNPAVHHAVVVQRDLRCGIRARVRRDGAFLFDFSSWDLAPITVIPGYTKPGTYPYTVPRQHTAVEERAESIAVFRAQVMNVHQLCLTTAERHIKSRGAAMGFPVTAWSTHKALTFAAATAYHDDVEDMHALAMNVLNNKDGIRRDRPLGRRTLEIEVVEYSLELLDRILEAKNPVLVQLVEAAYIASCRQREKRFGEAVTLAWSVCEQLVWSAWKAMLEEKANATPGRLPKDRRDKLTGRDYTASTVVEMLELHGVIDRELYRLLEIARKARNRWAHDLRVPGERDVQMCLRALQTLLFQVKKLPLVLSSGGRGGVPQWPVWMWEEIKQRGGP